MTIAPPCNKCGGRYVCAGCEQPLRTQLSSIETTESMPYGGSSSAVRQYLEAVKQRVPYTPTFPVGNRGGAMIDFGNAIVLECALPFIEDATGEAYPFMPLPLDGSIVHDICRKKAIEPWELKACTTGFCRCDSRPTGWVLTRAIVRALLSASDAYLNDHGRQLPGVISGSWALKYHTPIFMKECFFNSEFILPTRAASRAARADREACRGRRCKPPQAASRAPRSR